MLTIQQSHSLPILNQKHSRASLKSQIFYFSSFCISDNYFIFVPFIIFYVINSFLNFTNVTRSFIFLSFVISVVIELKLFILVTFKDKILLWPVRFILFNQLFGCFKLIIELLTFNSEVAGMQQSRFASLTFKTSQNVFLNKSEPNFEYRQPHLIKVNVLQVSFSTPMCVNVQQSKVSSLKFPVKSSKFTLKLYKIRLIYYHYKHFNVEILKQALRLDQILIVKLLK
ncbi:Hypothetical_protein [Hexamita inflata]|uniref:Hypothetical_protein n=1 Tax=Hexamita inflata TaxID=28002 RepID=A0AA86U7T8_9EUKA|nr:Hypothetical protein HINF_LOCUS28652 [Hexamita inflata]